MELVIVDPLPNIAKLVEVVANDILDKVIAVSDFISISMLVVILSIGADNILSLEALPTLDTTVSSLVVVFLVIILYLTEVSETSKDISKV